jgi:hypothetical protein
LGGEKETEKERHRREIQRCELNRKEQKRRKKEKEVLHRGQPIRR